jgi:hypothetical protein
MCVIIITTLPNYVGDRRVMTISQWLDATDRNMPARSLWQRQTRSMKDESEALSLSKLMITMKRWFRA